MPKNCDLQSYNLRFYRNGIYVEIKYLYEGNLMKQILIFNFYTPNQPQKGKKKQTNNKIEKNFQN